MNKSISIFWLRRDLRLNDNHGLFNALKSTNPVLPVFIFDKNILDPLADKKDKRVSFIYETLENIQEELVKLGSSLFCIYDEPLNAFKKICSSFNVKEVFTNTDYEPYAIKRDNEIAGFLKSKNILFHSYKDQVIFERSEILKSDETPYTIFTPYSKAWKQKFKEGNLHVYKSENLKHRFLNSKPFHFPSLKEIGFAKTESEFPERVIHRKIIASYDKTRNIPSIEGTSRLSVHLRFGTLSIRKLVRIAPRAK